MDTETLRIVELVARHGSFAAAARVLNTDPSAVSRTVAGLEASLGMRLFQRTTRSMKITEEGDRYLRRIIPPLEELEQAHEDARSERNTPAGTLRMTASVAFLHVCILPHLATFHDRYPEVTLELLPSDANLDIAANGIDLAVRLASAPKGELISTRLLQTRYMVCASPEYLQCHEPITNPRSLADHNCLRFALPEYRARWRFRRATESPFEVPVTGRTLIAGALSLRQAALDGLGPVLLANWLVKQDIAAGRLIQLFPDYDCTATEFDTGAWALFPSRNYMPRKVRVMLDFLKECLVHHT